MRRLFASIALTAAVLAPAAASAQQGGASQTPLVSLAASPPTPQQSAAFAPAPSVAASAAAPTAPDAMIHADVAGINTTSKTDAPLVMSAAPSGLHQGEGVALMAVGGAGLVAGLLIGNSAGTAVAIGGLAVGLYGLYQYVR